MGVLLFAWVCHVILVQLVAVPWWIPDLTLVGMILGIGRAPARWWLMASVAGGLTILWAVRMPVVIFGGYFVLGGLMRLASAQWNVTDTRVQMVAATGAALLLGLVYCGLDGVCSWQVLGWVALRSIGTGLSLFWIRRRISGRTRLPT